MSNFKDIISDVVDKVRLKYDPTNDVFPVFDYGHRQTIANRISQRVNSADDKDKIFPMIALLSDTDYTEQITDGLNYEVSGFYILIMNEREKDWTEEQSYTNNFDAILTPLYESFIKYLNRSLEVDSSSIAGGDRILHPNYGSVIDNKIPFGIAVDAIEIRNLNLEIIKKC